VPESPLIQILADRFAIPPAGIDLLAGREDRIVCRVQVGGELFVAKVSGTADAFGEEAAANARLHALGLPVSVIDTVEPGPPAIFVAGWAHGVRVTARTNPAALRDIGAILRRIHRLPATPPYSGNPTLLAWIEGWFRAVLHWWLEMGARASDVEALSWAWLAAVTPHLANREGAMTLFDGRPEHFLVDGAGAIRMIDVADLQGGDPAMDLAVLELDEPGILHPVLAGYGPSAVEMERFRHLVPFHVFLRALSAAEWQARIVGDSVASERYLAGACAALTRWASHEDTEAPVR